MNYVCDYERERETLANTRRVDRRDAAWFLYTTVVASQGGNRAASRLWRRRDSRVDRSTRETDESGKKERNGAERRIRRSARVLRARASVRAPGVIEINRRPHIARDGPFDGIAVKEVGGPSPGVGNPSRKKRKKEKKEGNVGNSEDISAVAYGSVVPYIHRHRDKLALRIIDIDIRAYMPIFSEAFTEGTLCLVTIYVVVTSILLAADH